MKALLVEGVHPDATANLQAAGVTVDTRPGSLDEAGLSEALQGVQLLGIRSGTRVTRSVLAAATDLIAVGAFCIGTNQVDLGAAAEKGVAVFNAPFSNTRSVVELALAEMICLTRGLTDKNHALHAGVWDKSAKGAHEMRGRTLGIIGYGNIGSQLSVLAEALGMRVAFFDTADRLARGNARSVNSVMELLEVADIVSLHVDGRVGNAGLFEWEQFASELRGLPNVILTPHVGGSTEEAQQNIGRFVADKLRDYVESGSTALSVNLPQTRLEGSSDSHRLAHLHANTPGVLAKVNSVLAGHDVNVEGQALSTRDQLGYLLTDVGTDYAPEVVEALAGMTETVRLRVLS